MPLNYGPDHFRYPLSGGYQVFVEIDELKQISRFVDTGHSITSKVRLRGLPLLLSITIIT